MILHSYMKKIYFLISFRYNEFIENELIRKKGM